MLWSEVKFESVANLSVKCVLIATWTIRAHAAFTGGEGDTGAAAAGHFSRNDRWGGAGTVMLAKNDRLSALQASAVHAFANRPNH